MCDATTVPYSLVACLAARAAGEMDASAVRVPALGTRRVPAALHVCGPSPTVFLLRLRSVADLLAAQA